MTWSSAILALALSLCSSSAFADECHVDLRRYTGGYANLLMCDGTRMESIYVHATGGRLDGVSFRQYAGEDYRSIMIDHTGHVFFLTSDASIRGGFYAQVRGASRWVFPRRHAMRIEHTGNHLVVHDPAGNAWTLTGAPHPKKPHTMSWAVTALNGRAQRAHAIDHSERGIVGIDARALGSLVLLQKEPSHRGMQDRRSAAYHRTRSVFVDAHGARCEVPNRRLFGPSATDPDDKYENTLILEDDAAVAALLAEACPKLDRSPLRDERRSSIAR